MTDECRKCFREAAVGQVWGILWAQSQSACGECPLPFTLEDRVCPAFADPEDPSQKWRPQVGDDTANGKDPGVL